MGTDSAFITDQEFNDILEVIIEYLAVVISILSIF